MGRPSGQPRSLQRRRRAEARPTARRARLWVGLQADGTRRESSSCGGAKRNAPVDDRGVVLGGCLTMTYFRARMRTIIGVLPFHGPVRDGKGWCRQAMVVRRRGESESSRPRWWARAEGKGGLVRFGAAQSYGIKPHGRLVPVSLTRCRASTSGLSTWWSATTLQGDQVPGRSHLQARFPLRCFQRLSLPYIATRRCDWRHNRYTSGTSTPVLSY